jgi:hypothetical protein
MAEYVWYAFQTAGTSADWTSPSYTVNGDNNQYGYCTTKNQLSTHLVLSNNEAPGDDIGTISAVHVAIAGYASVNGNAVSAAQQGGAPTYGAAYFGTSESIQYISCSAATAPGGSWDWNDFTSLNIEIWGYRVSGSGSHIEYVDQVWWRITYEPYASGPSNIAKVNSVAAASIAKAYGITYSDISKINTIA